MPERRVAVLGLGEAGGALAADLAQHAAVTGFDPAGVEPPAGVRTARTTAEAVEGCEIVLACVPAAASVETAAGVAAHLAPGAVYADCATAEPERKQQAAAEIAAGAGGFADVALMGAVPGHGLSVPMLLAGPAAEALAERLRAWGTPVEVVSGRPGDAAARKLLRSVVMKGLAGALTEALDAAAAAGCDAWLREEIAGELTAADGALVERLETGTRRHAARRVDEMEAAGALLARHDVPAEVTAATARRLRRLAGGSGAEPAPAADVEPHPSPQAWAAIRGAVDLQVHVAPDLPARRTDDLDLARDFLARGLAGFVLKSHYGSTAERAAVVRRAVPGVRAVGAVTLNHPVGGLNPVAVDVAGRGGARFVWLPTVDAANEVAHLAARERGEDGGVPNPPVWVAVREEMVAAGWLPEPIEVLDGAGRPKAALLDCLDAARAHDMVVATGHLGRDEIFAVVEAAVARGLERIVITHPEFPTQRLGSEEQAQLADMGALVEHCFTTAHTGKCGWDEIVENVAAVGPDRTVISTDLGQVANPPVAEGLAAFAQRLLDAGFIERDVATMTVANPTRLVGAPS